MWSVAGSFDFLLSRKLIDLLIFDGYTRGNVLANIFFHLAGDKICDVLGFNTSNIPLTTTWLLEVDVSNIPLTCNEITVQVEIKRPLAVAHAARKPTARPTAGSLDTARRGRRTAVNWCDRIIAVSHDDTFAHTLSVVRLLVIIFVCL